MARSKNKRRTTTNVMGIVVLPKQTCLQQKKKTKLNPPIVTSFVFGVYFYISNPQLH
jgi:hypothetical protein